MKWLWVVGGGVLAVVAAMVGFVSCQKSAVNEALDRSTAPLLVPRGEWQAAFDFTAPPGTTNLYLFRWNFAVGGTDGISGWQVGPDATYRKPKLAEAPDEAEVAEVLGAATDPDCEIVDPDVGIRLCTYPGEFEVDGVRAWLVRGVDAADGAATLVVSYSNHGGQGRTSYNPASLEARYLNAAFESVPIDGDAGDYLVYIY